MSCALKKQIFYSITLFPKRKEKQIFKFLSLLHKKDFRTESSFREREEREREREKRIRERKKREREK